MRFGRWSSSQPSSDQNESDLTIQAKSTSIQPGSKVSGEKRSVVYRKERSRYDIPEQRKPPSMEPSEKISLADVNVMKEYPVIDRVPTAIGYQSDGSDEEWLEEKSRCSRYDVSDHEVTDDELETDDVKEEENRDDEIGDDKYSQKVAKKQAEKETTESQHDTISALWSHSTDSESEKDKWDANSTSYEQGRVYGDNMSYAEEKGTDPIYDKNQTKRMKLKNAKPPNSPNGISDTSSMSDNLQKMLHFAPSNDKAGTDIEDNIHSLKVVAEENGSPIQEKKKSGRKLRRSTRAKKLSQRKSKSKDKIELSRSVSMKPTKSKDEIEMSRTVSIAEPAKQRALRPTKEKKGPEKSFDITTVIPENNTVPFSDDLTDMGSIKSGRQSRAMYTKSLLTEDSDTDTLQQRSIIPDPVISQITQIAPQDSHAEEGSVQSKKQRIGILLSNSWNLAGTMRTKSGQKRKEKDETKQSTGFFAKMRKQRKTIETGTASSTNISLTEIPAKLNSPRSKTSTEPKELDEYSKSANEVNDNEPDVVQCLRYFQCGSVANHVNVAITVANCGTTNENDPVEEVDDADGILDVKSTTPKPRVEVYLRDEQKPIMPRSRSVLSCRGSTSCKNDSPEKDDLSEVPGLGLSSAPSIIIDVTGMQLHLDGDSEMDRNKLSSVRGVGGSQTTTTKSDVSVTSISVPVLTTTQRESNEVANVKEDETELILEDYMKKIHQEKGIRGFFNKFKKSK